MFFPVSHSGPAQPDIERAKQVCARCRVCADCLDYAVETAQRHGIWGGMTEEERRHLRLQRGAVARRA